MQILTISGSSRKESSNSKLLDHLPSIVDHNFLKTDIHFDLPLFRAEMDTNPLPAIVVKWRALIKESDAVIICTPEYIHNIPAVIKNALEWIASSGELVAKPVIPITLTPNPPRGEKAMNSLLWCLQALDANIIVQLALYKSKISYNPHLEGEGAEMIIEAIKLIE